MWVCYYWSECGAVLGFVGDDEMYSDCLQPCLHLRLSMYCGQSLHTL